ncbi:MAG: acyl-CoA dehydrogenase [Desulfomonile sp.]|nr:acyl-CoA dehydrogenase [Desulfomonile sp.]
MANLLVDERDVKFVLYEQLRLDGFAQSDLYSEFSREMCDMILEAAYKFAENELWPINADGDAQGALLVDGHARAPESFHKAYNLYCENGWPLLSVETECGGQGCPIVLYCAVMESFVAANLAFTAYPGLTLGAARLAQKYGTDEQRSAYMHKMFSGEWGGTMCLTEPQAGSDVGALRTRAKRNPDGTYSIVGNKIFISSGDHDLCENIIHMVLARVEGAPPGTKGISIFIVPKKRIEGGSLVPNDVTTTAVEKKLGIHGSATCALSFGEKDACVGYLLGEENSGMKIMFDMMNEARLAVAFQGLGLASGAYMQALHYAMDRVQGSHYSQMRDPQAPKVPIIEHPDVRRMLMWMKSVTEGVRSLLYYTAFCVDRARTAADQAEAERHRGLIDLLIPIGKAWASDMGFRVTETAVQVYGGYGYCSEYPVEQYLRDIKITSIYEGTNAIQALDLVGRKLTYKQGALFRTFIEETEQVLNRIGDNPRLESVVTLFREARARLVEATTFFAQKGFSGDFLIPVLYASPYLELFGDVAVGFMLLWQAEIADAKLEEIYRNAGADTPEKQARVASESADAGYYCGKLASARFFANTFLSLSAGKAKVIMSGERSAVDVPVEAFLRR